MTPKKINSYVGDEIVIISSSKRASPNLGINSASKKTVKNTPKSTVDSTAKRDAHSGSGNRTGSTNKITMNGDSHVLTNKRSNIRRNLGDCFVKVSDVEFLKCVDASEAMSENRNFMNTQRVARERTEGNKNIGRDRCCSPTIPHTEPVLKWCGVRDVEGHLKVMKVSVTTPKRSSPTIGNGMNVDKIEILDLTLDSEDEAESGVNEKGKKNRDAKLKKLGISKEKSVPESKNIITKTKLKDGDISRLLDDEDSRDGMFALNDKTEDESKLKTRSNVKSGCSTRVSNIKIYNKAAESPSKSRNIQTSAKKKLSYDDKRADDKSVRKTDLAETEEIRKIDEQSFRNKKSSLSVANLNVSNNSVKLKTLNKAVVIDHHSESSPSRCRVRPQRKLPTNRTRCSDSDTEDEQSTTPLRSRQCKTGKSKDGGSLSRTKVKRRKRASSDDDCEPCSRTTSKQRSREECSDSEDDREPLSRTRSKRLKRAASSDSEDDREPLSRTRSKRLKRGASSDSDDDCYKPLRSKRHERAASSDSDLDLVPSTQSKSKRKGGRPRKKDRENEPPSPLKSQKMEPGTPRTPTTGNRTPSCIRSSSRKPKPNKRYDSDWSLATVELVRKQDKVATPVTPKTSKSKTDTRASTTSKKSSARRMLLTPSMPTRTVGVSTPGSVLEEARARLHVSAVPTSLPCREKEFENIYRFVECKILDKTGGCMYISGVPGTGKTATVKEVVRSLQHSASQREIPDFQFVELNGMRLTEPRQVFVQLLKSLSNQAMTSEQAQQALERKFSATMRKTVLLLVDELDLLWTRRQDVVYSLLDWPTRPNSRLVVLTIANTMDLPERLLMGRVTSRLGLTRVTFHPYSHKQLQEIVMTRLKGLQAFDSDAVQLVARKVAAVSGDARRALDICRRAAEIAEMDTKGDDGVVTMQHVDQALTEMIASPKVQAIRLCSKLEQLFLQAVAAEVQRTGIEETVFEKVFRQLSALCVFDGYGSPTVTEALGVCARLGSCRLLLTEHSRADIYQRVLLNVSSDDIHYALQVN